MQATQFDSAFSRGERSRLVPIGRLASLREELGRFRRDEALNGFQEWIIDELYDFRSPEGFSALSVLVVAVPHPFYAQVELAHGGKRYPCLSLVAADFEATEASLRAALPEGKNMAPAGSLPLKRLAVHSGLSVYGRNNVTYIEGLGSNFSYMAFFTDLPCDEDTWGEARVASACSRCAHCLSRCPTGAIRKERFLIDNERCLSNLNESPEPFPDWLDPGVHHTLYDCLRCQVGCPMNKGQEGKTVGPILFSESETEALLGGLGFDRYPPELAEKARYLGLDKWPAGIPKNVKALIELGERKDRAPLRR
jgi:epoxyqueuosine reductase